MKYRTNLLRLILLALFAISFNANTAIGQNYIAFTPNGLSGWPDTIPRGDTATVGGWLKNYSSTPFTTMDSLYIVGTVDTGSGPVPFSFDFSTLPIQLVPGDSSFMLLPFIYDTSSFGPQFHVGNNVVVVWPIGVGPGSFVPGDSVFLNVFVLGTSGLGPDSPPNDVRIYPVPANGPLVITSHHPTNQVIGIVIYDALGQIVYRSAPNATGPIDTDSWAPGLYTIETTFSDGSLGYYKILRQ